MLSAANPVYGQYNRSKKPSENIALPDSLLSRFDLMFIVLDNLDAGHDRQISHHVLKMHMYKRPGTVFGEAQDEGEEADLVGTSLTAGRDPSSSASRATPITHKFFAGGKDGEEIFTIEFIKKYLTYAKVILSLLLSFFLVFHIVPRLASCHHSRKRPPAT